MKIIKLLFLALFLCGINLNAQYTEYCGERNQTFEINNVADLERFESYYGECEYFWGNIEIAPSYTNLQDLLELSHLKVINGDLDIHGEHILSLEGLNNLERVNGNVSIRHAENINSLSGLESLNYIRKNLRISNMESLTSLNGLENLGAVWGDLILDEIAVVGLNGLSNLSILGESLYINECENIRNLEGLRYLAENNSARISFLSITNNPYLMSIEALDAIDSIEGIYLPFTPEPREKQHVAIYNNPYLSSCAVDAICNDFASGVENARYGYNVYNNNMGCLNIYEIEVSCDICPIPEEVYAADISDNFARIDWSPSNASSWNVRLFSVDDYEWVTDSIEVQNSEYTFNDLDFGKTYRALISANCNNDNSSSPVNVEFTTLIHDGTCPNPNSFEINVERISHTEAIFFSSDEDAHYQGSANLLGRGLRPRPMYGMNNIMSEHIQGGLIPNFSYDTWFRRICDNGTFSEWVGPYSIYEYYDGGSGDEFKTAVSVTPNPTTGMILFNEVNIEHIQVYNQLGFVVLEQRVKNNKADISKLGSGNYIINAIDSKNNKHTFNVIKK